MIKWTMKPSVVSPLGDDLYRVIDDFGITMARCDTHEEALRARDALLAIKERIK